MKTPVVFASRSVRGQSTCRRIGDRYAGSESKEHGIRPNRPIWMAIAALALGLAVQSVGCTTPEQRHRILTIFFDGVPPLYPVEPAPLRESFEAGESPEPARAPVVNRIVSVHGPVAEKECDQCHSSRYSNRLKAEKEDLCWTCHDRAGFVGEVIHGPFEAGFCQGCHEPHRSQYEFLLVSDKADLCEGCHEQYDMAVIAEHRSGEADLCQSCHDPHAADRKYMLKRNEDSS